MLMQSLLHGSHLIVLKEEADLRVLCHSCGGEFCWKSVTSIYLNLNFMEIEPLVLQSDESV